MFLLSIIQATVKEAVTGTSQSESASIKFTYTPFKIYFGSSPVRHILGGFPYVGKVVVNSHDGAPLPGTRMEIWDEIEQTLLKHLLLAFHSSSSSFGLAVFGYDLVVILGYNIPC